MKRLLLSAILLLLLAGPGNAEFPVHFGDSRLKDAVEAALWIVDPKPADMLGLTSLTANSRSISSLVGLETASHLTTLEMTHNQVGDLTPLSGLPNLSTLIMNTNEISDLTPLSPVKSLTHLNLHANRISDISPLSGLSNLRTLILRVNQISDISPLSGLTTLGTLNLEDNRITSISALSGLRNLREAHLGFNQISDLTPVCSLANLSYLDVHHNNVRDISCLTSLTSLRRLDLRNNPLSPNAYDDYIPRIRTNNPGIYIEHDSHAGRILRVSSTIGGSVIDPGEGEFTYDNDAYVRLAAKADPGFEFAGWSGSYSNSVNPLFITLTSDVTIQATFVSMLTEIYVDDDASGDPGPANAQISNPLEDGTFARPYDTIQEALNVAADGASVSVRPGVYRENVKFLGKRVYVIAVDPANLHAGPCATIEGVGNGPVVHINPGGADKCSLVGFVITRGVGQSTGAIYCSGSNPTIGNCLIVGNRCTGSDGATLYFKDSQATLTHCTIADNYAGGQGAGLTLIDSSITMTNSILWGNMPQEIERTGSSNPVIHYCAVRGWWPDLGNIHSDPLFARPGIWVNCENPNENIDPQSAQAVWIEGDYHLKSRAGRWDPAAQAWTVDAVTSPCIDGGAPQDPVAHESLPNSGRVNMGVYGGTGEASKSDSP